MSVKAWLFRLYVNLYPPFLGAGVRIERITSDYREIDVAMPLRWYNRNYVGTQFGGSLYAMTDPFYMLMLMQALGPGYIVWDQAARIEFLRPGQGRVRARFRLDDAEVARLRAEAESGAPLRPVYTVEVRDEQDGLVARVEKTLYVRKKPPKPA
jgi:acyl-coenzyme A thioesterase PaaI-like protein